MKLSHVIEMAGPAQKCPKCGQGPLHKTHTWVKGVGWKCRKNKSVQPDDVSTPAPEQPSVQSPQPASQSKQSSFHNTYDAWLAVATDDYQRRGDRYPKSNVPVAIDVYNNDVMFSFKNTTERDAKQWVAQFIQRNKLAGSLAGSAQAGNYADDWVEVWVR